MRYLTALALMCAALSSATAAKPNVIFIVADDLGYADLGVHGCKDIPTPHIDALAKNGVRCSNGYVSGPYCSPTRAGLITGRYQQRFGHEFNPGPAVSATIDLGLSLNETTLPQVFKSGGYRTGMVGKWHLGHAKQFLPTSRGFEEFYGFLGGANPYLNPPNILRGAEAIKETDYLTDAFTREAVAYIDRHKSEPFFLYLTYNAVHGPLQAPPKYLQRFEKIQPQGRRTYAAMLSALDDGIGLVMNKLKTENLFDNTLVCFISDNGGPENVNFSDNGPFRGQKASTWEGGIHIPYFLHWPNGLPKGAVYTQPVIQLDLFPTALAAAGVEAKTNKPIDGVNLLPFLNGENKAAPHDALYWRFGAQMAIRMGDWKLIKARGDAQAFNRSEVASAMGANLFNLKEDEGEKTDLAGSKPEKVKELQEVWNKWNATLEKPTWGQGGAKKGKAKNKEKDRKDLD
ncbi:MAG: sulfatase [Gemmataceae bacterium]|nr:sulfatase [Gemmataceae bacterium]